MKWEDTPDYSTLKRISEILKVPPAYFYTEDDQLAEIIKIFEQLDQKNKSKLYKIINKKHSINRKNL